MIIQIILNALIGLQMNIFAFVMIMQDEQKQKKKSTWQKNPELRVCDTYMPKLVSLKYI